MVIDFTVFAYIVCFTQLFYWVFFFNSISLVPKNNHVDALLPVSIIVCIKNSMVNLRNNIPSWYLQKVNEIELFIADDFSEQEIEVYVKKLQKDVRCISYHKVTTNKNGKKQALVEALTNCRHNWVLLTDVDCRPNTENWAKSMLSSAIQNNAKVVLGYSPTHVNSNCLLDLWAHYETWITGVLYLSFAKRKIPYMGVGRNLLYDKKAFDLKNINFHEELPSGDDDLLIQSISNGNNTVINLDKDAFVTTSSPSSWSQYFDQKRRHMTTSFKYKTIHKLLLGLFSMSHILFYTFLFASCFFNPTITVIMVLLKLSLLLVIGRKCMSVLSAQFSFRYLLLFDICLSIYYLIFAVVINFFPKKSW